MRHKEDNFPGEEVGILEIISRLVIDVEGIAISISNEHDVIGSVISVGFPRYIDW